MVVPTAAAGWRTIPGADTTVELSIVATTVTFDGSATLSGWCPVWGLTQRPSSPAASRQSREDHQVSWMLAFAMLVEVAWAAAKTTGLSWRSADSRKPERVRPDFLSLCVVGLFCC